MGDAEAMANPVSKVVIESFILVEPDKTKNGQRWKKVFNKPSEQVHTLYIHIGTGPTFTKHSHPILHILICGGGS